MVFGEIEALTRMPRESTTENNKPKKRQEEVIDLEELLRNSLPNWSALWYAVANKDKKKGKASERKR